jgi:hypothetical protein
MSLTGFRPRHTSIRVSTVAVTAGIALAFAVTPALSQGVQPRATGAAKVAAARPAEPTAAAAVTATVNPSAPAASAYRIAGFRSARFGMTREQVMAAIMQDFQIPAGNVQALDNPVDGTVVLVATPARLDPAPGTTSVSYIFGKTSRKLVHVNVVWALPASTTAAERDMLVAAGIKLGAVFEQRSWGKGGLVKNVPVAANSLVLVQARDETGAAVEIRMDGVSYRQQTNGKSVDSPVPTTEARLRLAYSQNPAAPDVTKLKDGQF